MARPSKSERLKAKHQAALISFDRVQAATRDERKLSLEDRRFASIPGGQWEGPFADMFKNKPKIEVNKIMLSIMRIISEYRNNRITVDFVSKDGATNDDLADTCDSLYRADEQDSVAQEAYDNAFEEALSGGFGAWRLRACYEDEYDEDSERQRVRFEPIYDADISVFFDLDAKRQDKSDAKECWVIYSMSRAAYVDEHGDDPASWPRAAGLTYFDWCTPDVVYIAEYYCVEEVRETVHHFANIEGDKRKHTDEELIEMSEPEDEEDTEGSVVAGIAMLEEEGFVEVRSKRVKRRAVHKYLMSGGGILEDCGLIAGKYIPIIPVYGKRWFIDNIERFMGHTRLAKDPQRLKNMQLSKLAEISALSSVSKPILHPEQIAGHQIMWSEDNVKNYPYLLINMLEASDGSVVPGGPVAYTKSPEIPQAMAALLQLTEQDMSEILGRQQDGEKLEPNMSGKAVELVQQRLDMQSFIYLSNFAKALQHCGAVWLSMARELYREDGRVMKGVGEAGNIEGIELGREMLDEKTGEPVKTNDISKADFDVAVDVGPSFSSKREATVRALTGMMAVTADPETMKILQAMVLMNMDGEGLGDVREYYRKQLVAMGVMQPNEEERKAMAEQAENQQPSANDQYLAAEAKKSEAEAVKALADTELANAKVENTQADTLKILKEIGEPTAPQ